MWRYLRLTAACLQAQAVETQAELAARTAQCDSLQAEVASLSESLGSERAVLLVSPVRCVIASICRNSSLQCCACEGYDSVCRCCLQQQLSPASGLAVLSAAYLTIMTVECRPVRGSLRTCQPHRLPRESTPAAWKLAWRSSKRRPLHLRPSFRRRRGALL